MNKRKFLEVLNHNLRHLPKEDREDAIAYYEEYFAEMNLSEDEDVTLKVGQPEDVARDILGNCTEKHLDEQKEKGGIRSSATVIWMIILGIFASPIAIPLAIAFVAIVFSCVVAMASIVFAFVCAPIGARFTNSMCAPGMTPISRKCWRRAPSPPTAHTRAMR